MADAYFRHYVSFSRLFQLFLHPLLALLQSRFGTLADAFLHSIALAVTGQAFSQSGSLSKCQEIASPNTRIVQLRTWIPLVSRRLTSKSTISRVSRSRDVNSRHQLILFENRQFSRFELFPPLSLSIYYIFGFIGNVRYTLIGFR